MFRRHYGGADMESRHLRTRLAKTYHAAQLTMTEKTTPPSVSMCPYITIASPSIRSPFCHHHVWPMSWQRRRAGARGAWVHDGVSLYMAVANGNVTVATTPIIRLSAEETHDSTLVSI
jgi:hypothetical protein